MDTTNTTNAATLQSNLLISIKGELIQQDVEMSLGGVRRVVTIERYTPRHCWHARCTVTIKYRTGKKLHSSFRPQVTFAHGQWNFTYENRHGCRGVRPVAFVDQLKPNANW